MKVTRTSKGNLKIVLNETEEGLLKNISVCNTVENLTEYGVNDPQETDEFLDELYCEIVIV